MKIYYVNITDIHCSCIIKQVLIILLYVSKFNFRLVAALFDIYVFIFIYTCKYNEHAYIQTSTISLHIPPKLKLPAPETPLARDSPQVNGNLQICGFMVIDWTFHRINCVDESVRWS